MQVIRGNLLSQNSWYDEYLVDRFCLSLRRTCYLSLRILFPKVSSYSLIQTASCTGWVTLTERPADRFAFLVPWRHWPTEAPPPLLGNSRPRSLTWPWPAADNPAFEDGVGFGPSSSRAYRIVQVIYRSCVCTAANNTKNVI